MKFCWALISFVLVGCGGIDYRPETFEPKLSAATFHDFIESLDGGSKEITTDSRNTPFQIPDGGAYEHMFCYVDDVGHLKAAISKYCLAKGGAEASGSYNNNWSKEPFTWCKYSSTDMPLFGYKLKSINRTCYEMVYLSTTSSQPTTPYKHFAAVNMGYVTEADRRDSERRSQERALAREREEKFRDELRQLHIAEFGRRGTEICQDRGQYGFQAVVEEVANSNFKVLVQRAWGMLAPSDFSPHYLWVDPADWQACPRSRR